MATTVRQADFNFSCSVPKNILDPKNILKVVILSFQHLSQSPSSRRFHYPHPQMKICTTGIYPAA